MLYKMYTRVGTALCLALIAACGFQERQAGVVHKEASVNIMKEEIGGLDTATFGAGCFWCVEAVFQNIKGVSKVLSGYSGGRIASPTYREVSSGLTGHAEVVQIYFDPGRISYEELLELFWNTHDPTTPNRQGADVGDQYRSVVFYHNEEQRKSAEDYKKRLNSSGAFSAPVVTEIVPLDVFYVAENYHQGFYNGNKDYPYCRMIIQPKLDKLRKEYGSKLRS
jgi:peptide-methionine (S)-S-oxide reductase